MNNYGLDVNSTISLEGSDSNKLFAVEVNGVTIDVAILNFSNRLVIILTQFGKLGSLVSVRRNALLAGEEREDIFDVRTLFGDDRLDYHITARTIAESISVDKPLLFGIALRDVTFPTVRAIRKALLENKIW